MADPEGMFSAQQSRAGHPDPRAEGRQRGDHRQDGRGAGHVRLHRDHPVGRLERDAARVERDALADQDDVREPLAAREVLGEYVSSTSRGGRTEPMPTARIPPKPWAASSASSRTRTVTPLGVAATAWSREPCGRLGGRRSVGQLAREVHGLRGDLSAADGFGPAVVDEQRDVQSRQVRGHPPEGVRRERQAFAEGPHARPPDAPRRPATATDTRPPSAARRSRSARPTEAPARRSAPTVASPEPTSRSALSGLSPSGRSIRAPARVGLVDRARWASTAALSGPPRPRSSPSSALGRVISAPSRGALTSATRMSGRSAGVSPAAARRTGSGMGSPCHANGPGTPWAPGPPGGPVGNEQTSADG